MLLEAIIKEKSIDEFVEKYGSKKLKAKKKDVEASVMEVLREMDTFELKICLENVNGLEDQIR